ncbi:MAG TPA: hypothetical protein VGD43_00315 [Micromonospora sp.]
MKIDERVESLTRAVLDAAVRRDRDAFEAALGAYPDEETARAGLEVTTAIAAFVLLDQYEGNLSEEQLTELAGEISAQESWIGAAPAEIRALLSALVGGVEPDEAIVPERLVPLLYAVTANLLAPGAAPEERKWWLTYLDKVEATLQA